MTKYWNILTPSSKDIQNPLNSDSFKRLALETVWCDKKDFGSLTRSCEVDVSSPITNSMYGWLAKGIVDRQIWAPKLAFTLNSMNFDVIGKYI